MLKLFFYFQIIQPYNYNFNLTAPMPGCDISQTRSLVMQSPLKLKEYQSRVGRQNLGQVGKIVLYSC